MTKPSQFNGESPLNLDGQTVFVRWDDGDTFAVADPNTGKRRRARLMGYNTLETYGPVHRWGQWTAQELHRLAYQARTVAASQQWRCETQPGGGGYGRLLVDCPTLRQELLSLGLGHLFVMDTPAINSDLETQSTAIREGRGIWAKGAPAGVITSLHSAAEKRNKKPYNRVCSLDDGQATVRHHEDVYETCQEVCMDGSCMVYVPYKMRYGSKRAGCLISSAERTK